MLIDLFMGESCPFSVIFWAKLNYLRWLSPFYIFAKFILDSCGLAYEKNVDLNKSNFWIL
jgi:hypothetical protein